jgi:hypothetical protein
MITICFSFQGKRIVLNETHTSPDVYNSKCATFDCDNSNPNVADISVITKRKRNIFDGIVYFVHLQILYLKKQ